MPRSHGMFGRQHGVARRTDIGKFHERPGPARRSSQLTFRRHKSGLDVASGHFPTGEEASGGDAHRRFDDVRSAIIAEHTRRRIKPQDGKIVAILISDD